MSEQEPLTPEQAAIRNALIRSFTSIAIIALGATLATVGVSVTFGIGAGAIFLGIVAIVIGVLIGVTT